nr:hypothetical protein [Escherichia coli]
MGERNSRAIAFQARTLQAHERRMNSQQRQINENHEEMKRAAASQLRWPVFPAIQCG